MPQLVFNPSLAVCQNLFALFLERHPYYNGPDSGPQALNKCKEVVMEVMQEQLRNLKYRQSMALVDFEDTRLE